MSKKKRGSPRAVTSMVRVYREDVARINDEVFRQNVEHQGETFLATQMSVIREALRGYFHCRSCGNLLKDCKCN